MSSATAVRVNDYLPPGQPRVPMWPADREVATRVNLDFRIAVDEVVGNDRTDDLRDKFTGDDILVDSRFVP